MVSIIQWFKDLFKPKFHILPVKVMGSLVYTPVVANLSGDWTPFISQPFDSQNEGNWDELNCVTQSGINAIETVLNYYVKNNLYPILTDFLKGNGYLDAQGFVKLSTRFTAKMAGTTKQGLGMDSFWASVNKDGILPYTAYPDPSGTFDWNTYYQPIPQAIINAGKSAAGIFNFDWKVCQNNNWNPPVITNLKKDLIDSPLHWCGMDCALDASGIERWCKADYYVHARMVYNIDNYIEVLDSEMPALKKLELAFPIPCYIKFSLKLI
jgi:hypothetical protein